MVDKDIVLEKVKQIQQCLKRIHEKTTDDPTTLDSFETQDIFVLNLQRAVQSCLDLATHIVADEALGTPSELKENFILLEKEKILTHDLSVKLQKMVGFRNIAVHDYSALDVEILKSILQNNLKDFEEFYTAILKRFSIVK